MKWIVERTVAITNPSSTMLDRRGAAASREETTRKGRDGCVDSSQVHLPASATSAIYATTTPWVRQAPIFFSFNLLFPLCKKSRGCCPIAPPSSGWCIDLLN